MHMISVSLRGTRLNSPSPAILIIFCPPQFDDPTVLLEQPESFFAKLVSQAGDQRDVLRSMVFEAARKKQLAKQQ
jgi:hypothetical protein